MTPGKMLPGKVPPEKYPPEISPPGKLPPGKLTPLLKKCFVKLLHVMEYLSGENFVNFDFRQS